MTSGTTWCGRPRSCGRGELWIATQSCDCYLKGLVVTLLAWHARAADPGTETWHRGRFLERWADPQELRELGHAFAGCDAAEVARALWATAELFQRLERECAERLGLTVSVPIGSCDASWASS